MSQGTCIVLGCNDPIRARERCERHYGQARRSREIEPLERPSVADRLAANIESVENGCWIWNPRRCYTNGYGEFSIGKKHVMAHRAVYELNEGPIPAGLVLDHLCRNPPCVNPAHLEPVSRRDNHLRGISPGALIVRNGVCKRGHPRTPENLYTAPSQPTSERCYVCVTERRAERYAREKAALGIPDRKPKGTCKEADCGREHYGLGWCKAHYQRLRNAG